MDKIVGRLERTRLVGPMCPFTNSPAFQLPRISVLVSCQYSAYLFVVSPFNPRQSPNKEHIRVVPAHVRAAH